MKMNMDNANAATARSKRRPPVEGLSAEERAWDDFVLQHPLRTPFHLSAWKKCLVETFAYQPYYLTSTSDGAIDGVLPLFLVKNWVIGKVLISTPFAVYGGILANSEAAKQRLVNEATALAKKLAVDYLELRNIDPQQSAGFSPVDRYVDFIQYVQPGDQELLLAALPRKVRNLIRKSLKSPFCARRAPALSGFLSVMAENYRRLGTPIFPDRWFESLVRHFGEVADVREVLLNGQIATASMNFLLGDRVYNYYAGSREHLLPLAPNNFMYFEQLLWAGNEGFRIYDFGRSKIDSGNYEFKKQWATELHPLPYEVLLVERKELPNISPTNPKFHLVIQIWRRMPIWLTRVIGPRLIGMFP
jgi:FemAB-related protein (PEP-CTERM system-associated)